MREEKRPQPSCWNGGGGGRRTSWGWSATTPNCAPGALCVQWSCWHKLEPGAAKKSCRRREPPRSRPRSRSEAGEERPPKKRREPPPLQRKNQSPPVVWRTGRIRDFDAVAAGGMGSPARAVGRGGCPGHAGAAPARTGMAAPRLRRRHRPSHPPPSAPCGLVIAMDARKECWRCWPAKCGKRVWHVECGFGDWSARTGKDERFRRRRQRDDPPPPARTPGMLKKWRRC